MSEEEEKLNLRRLEPAIQKFIKVAIPTDLERLRKHQINIEKVEGCRAHHRLHAEHINGKTLLQQLRANIREMEKLCLRVRKEDLPALQRMISPVKEEALSALRTLKSQDETFHDPETEGASQSFNQLFSPLPEIPQDQNAAESWETLEEDLIELGNLVTDFSLLVHSQQEKIDRIEDHVHTASVNVEEGTRSLGKAAKYKLAALPVAGAVIGGIVGGPIGLLAGFKVAGIAAALGGGLLGFSGGKLIQRKRQKTIEDISCSCPDLPRRDDGQPT
ncbi:PREDICTED: syntaxin-17 [Gekko japonicus]|uniref:Syntaxin-17 n=1 Tax=Gekko japonicus TaxID=146911 RepID=A0ABM1JQB3_GEKJA|nr:PREDICTED: syntaxin-17 [Gekko japonicus]